MHVCIFHWDVVDVLVCAISIDNLNATHTSTEDKILKDNINEDVSRFVCRSFYFVLSKKQQTHPA